MVFKSMLRDVLLLTGLIFFCAGTIPLSMAATPGLTGLQPLYRMWHGGIKDHFYTTSTSEKDNAASRFGYSFQRITGYIFADKQPGTVALNRYWHTKGDHFYTAQSAEHVTAVQRFGYTYEGVTGYLYPDKHPNTVPLFRFWSQKIQDHLYSTDRHDAAAADPDNGYRFEGVTGYIYTERHGPAQTKPPSVIRKLSCDPGASEIFSDDFSSGRLDHWGGSAGQRDVENGIASFRSGNHTSFELLRRIPVENVTVQWIGMAKENGFHGHMGPYHFNIGGWSNNGSGYAGPGVPFKKVQTGAVYKKGQFHHYRLARKGDNWSAWVDGRQLFSVRISGRADDGNFRFTTYHGTLQIDRILICSTDGSKGASIPEPQPYDSNLSGQWTTMGLDGRDWDLKAQFTQKGNHLRVDARTFYLGYWRPWQGQGAVNGKTVTFDYHVEPGNNYGWVDGKAWFTLSADGRMLSGAMQADNATWGTPVILFRK